MTTPVTSIWGGGLMFDLTFQLSRRGRDIVIIRNGVPVSVGTPPNDTTTQRVVPAPQDRENTEPQGPSGHTGRNWLIIIGWRVGADTDLDVQHGDKFQLDGVTYRVTAVDDTVPNRREALADTVS